MASAAPNKNLFYSPGRARPIQAVLSIRRVLLDKLKRLGGRDGWEREEERPGKTGEGCWMKVFCTDRVITGTDELYSEAIRQLDRVPPHSSVSLHCSCTSPVNLLCRSIASPSRGRISRFTCGPGAERGKYGSTG